MVVILITIPRLITPKYSSYSISSTSFTGTIIKIIKHDDYNTLYIKNKETIIGTIQVKNNFHLGEKITINRILLSKKYLLSSKNYFLSINKEE